MMVLQKKSGLQTLTRTAFRTTEGKERRELYDSRTQTIPPDRRPAICDGATFYDTFNSNPRALDDQGKDTD
jgi:hypothetical protein